MIKKKPFLFPHPYNQAMSFSRGTRREDLKMATQVGGQISSYSPVISFQESQLEDAFRWGETIFYSPYQELSSSPEMKVAILTCMDCRIITASFGINHPGKAIIIRTAGGLFTSDTLRSLLIAIYDLGVRMVAIVGHNECGGRMSPEKMDLLIQKISSSRNISKKEILAMLGAKCASEALLGFDDEVSQVRGTVEKIRACSLIPGDIVIRGYLYDTKHGRIRKLI